MRSRVFKHMLKTRGRKYRTFLRYLRIFKYISFNWSRGQFLEYYYTLMRFLDDVVDGDAPLPEAYPDSERYLCDKIFLAENPVFPKDEADFIMLYCFEIAKRFGADFKQETLDILNSLLFDAKRKGKLTVISEKELEEHFHLLDIKGTISGTLKIFNENPDKFTILKSLGMATRYQFDLEDFESDIEAGYVNISQEDCITFEISKEDLNNPESPGVKKWFEKRAKQGLGLIFDHRKRLVQGNFSWLTRATLFLIYEAPARRYFKKVLNGKHRKPK